MQRAAHICSVSQTTYEITPPAFPSLHTTCLSHVGQKQSELTVLLTVVLLQLHFLCWHLRSIFDLK